MVGSTGCTKVQAGDMGVRYGGGRNSWPRELSSFGCLTIVGIMSGLSSLHFPANVIPGWALECGQPEKEGQDTRVPREEGHLQGNGT